MPTNDHNEKIPDREALIGLEFSFDIKGLCLEERASDLLIFSVEMIREKLEIRWKTDNSGEDQKNKISN